MKQSVAPQSDREGLTMMPAMTRCGSEADYSIVCSRLLVEVEMKSGSATEMPCRWLRHLELNICDVRRQGLRALEISECYWRVSDAAVDVMRFVPSCRLAALKTFRSMTAANGADRMTDRRMKDVAGIPLVLPDPAFL